MKKSFLAALMSAAVLLPSAAFAADAKDLQVIGRALSFVEGGAKGEVTVAVVYSDDAAGSKAEAEQVVALIGAGMSAGGVTMKAKLVPMSGLAGAGDVAAIYVPKGMSAHYGALGAKKKLTVSTDKSCAESGGCVLAVESSPKVEILVNRASAAAASITFGSAFRMMIKEI